MATDGAGERAGTLWRPYGVTASGPARRFEITGGLREGYALDNPEAALCEVVAAHHAWQRETGNVLGVLIQPATVSYGWPEDGAIRADSEPGFILSGTINVLYQGGEGDRTCLARIRHLAIHLAGWLGQRRIYLTYQGVAEILDRAEEAGE